MRACCGGEGSAVLAACAAPHCPALGLCPAPLLRRLDQAGESLRKAQERAASAEAEGAQLSKALRVSRGLGGWAAAPAGARAAARQQPPCCPCPPGPPNRPPPCPRPQAKEGALEAAAVALAGAQGRIEALEADLTNKANLLKGISQVGQGERAGQQAGPQLLHNSPRMVAHNRPLPRRWRRT